MLSPNHGLADKRNGPWAVPKSSESSHTETFSLSGCKTCAILARILGRAAPIHALGLLSLNIFKDRGLRATNLHSKFYFMHAIARITLMDIACSFSID